MLLNVSLMAQTVINGERIDGTKYDELWDKFEYFDLFELNSHAIHQAVSSQTESNYLNLKLGEFDWSMELFPNEVHSQDASALVYDGEKATKVALPGIMTYKGQLKGNAHSRVDMTITENMIIGIIDDGKNHFFIEKAHNILDKAGQNEYIVYNTNSVIDNPHLSCGMDEVHNREENINKSEIESIESSACYEVIIGLATDAGMATKHGGPFGAQAHAIGILTLVQNNYDNEFLHEIKFVIGAHFNASGSDPGAWNFSSIGNLLGSFGSWANGGGFGTTAYNVATLWTSRSYGGVIGLAWVNALCGGNRYNICVDFSGNSNSLRNLQAHELGHNFGLTHDGSGSPHIMAPAVNGSNTWSSQSVSQMNGNIPFSCMGGCIGVNPPIADFTATPTMGCAPMVVQFTDLSSNNPSSWRWTFIGGVPATSTQQNPVVNYPNPGSFNVQLEVSNQGGSTVEIKNFFIDVGTVPIPNFSSAVVLDEVHFQDESIVYGAANYLWDFGDGNFSTDVNPSHKYDLDGTYVVKLTIETLCGTRVIQKTINVVTPPTAEFSADTTNLCIGTSIQFTNLSSYNAETYQWVFHGGSPMTSSMENPTVRYDSAGVFTVELIARNTRYQDVEKKTAYIRVDSQNIAEFSADIDLDLLEVDFTTETPNARSFKWLFGDGSMSSSKDPSHTYAKDSIYTVTLITGNYCGDDTTVQTITVGRLPEADFSADQTMGCLPVEVEFEDLSSDNTTRRVWKFEGGDPASSTEENPTVEYDAVGTYKVTLIAINGLGNDTSIQEDYITIEDTPLSDFDFTRNGFEISFMNNSQNATSYSWDFGDGNQSMDENPTHMYGGDGDYNVVLIVENGCGRDTIEKEVSISNFPNANFTANVFSGCVPLTVDFENLSSTNTESVEWIIPGASPGTTTDVDPSITFNNPGLYRVTLIAKNGFGNDTVVRRDYIEVLDVPEAGFTQTTNGFNVDFTSDSKYGKTFMWFFGDGATSDLENPSHVYTDEGVYTVMLVVSNQCGNDTIETEVTVTPRPIVAFTSDVTEICVGDTVNYMDMSANTPTSWTWSFEGGDPDMSSDQNPTVVYKTAGEYRVQLEATNGFGSNESVVDEYVTVYDNPVSLFDYETQGIRVNFINESEQYGEVTWEFGDGETSNEVDPSHLYKRPGTYTVTLTVNNPCGESVFTTEVSVKFNGLDIFNLNPPPSPNPTNGNVVIEHFGEPSVSMIIRIAGLDGQMYEVFEGDFTYGHIKENLDLSFLTEGTYFMFIQTEGNVRMEKIVIQK